MRTFSRQHFFYRIDSSGLHRLDAELRFESRQKDIWVMCWKISNGPPPPPQEPLPSLRLPFALLFQKPSSDSFHGVNCQ